MNLAEAQHEMSAEIVEGEVLAAHLRLSGLTTEAKAVDADVAHLRREHRTLWVESLYELTGSPIPEYTEPDVTKVVRERLARRLKEEAA